MQWVALRKEVVRNTPFRASSWLCLSLEHPTTTSCPLWGQTFVYKLVVLPKPFCSCLQGRQGTPARHTAGAGVIAAAQYRLIKANSMVVGPRKDQRKEKSCKISVQQM